MTAEEYFGPEAGKVFHAVLDNVHKFAHRTGALPGDDVFQHFHERWESYVEANRKERLGE
jgi:hypothetical protein